MQMSERNLGVLVFVTAFVVGVSTMAAVVLHASGNFATAIGAAIGAFLIGGVSVNLIAILPRKPRPLKPLKVSEVLSPRDGTP